MLKRLSAILAAMVLVISLSVSFTASAEKLASSETGKVVVFSCDDAAAAGIEGSGITIADGSAEGDKVHASGSRSVKWSGGSLYLRLAGKGVTQIPNKKKLCIRVYNPSENTLRTNLSIYDANGTEMMSHKSYPICSYLDRSGEENGWDTIKLDISGVKNWPADAETAISVSLTNPGQVVYIDSAWVEYTPAGLTQKYDNDSVLLYNMGSEEYKNNAAGDIEYLRVLGGSGSFDAACAEDGKYAYKWTVSAGNALKCSRYGLLKSIDLNDFADKGYNLVFRMKSAIPEGESLPLNIWFSPVYVGAGAKVNSSSYPADKTFYVTPDAWHDYAVPLSNLTKAIADDGTMNTVLWQAGAKTESGSVLYIDRVFIAKQQSAETLDKPVTMLESTEADRYLQGGNKVEFIFDENLKTTGVDYVSAVTVQKSGDAAREGAAVSVNGKILSIVLADALDADSEYTITLNKDYIMSESGKKMAENYTKTFTTAAEACVIENTAATQSGASGVISNNTPNGRRYTVAVAAYKDNSLESVKLVPGLWVSPMTENNISVTFDEDVSACDAYKLFVWDSLNSMVPFKNR